MNILKTSGTLLKNRFDSVNIIIKEIVNIKHYEAHVRITQVCPHEKSRYQELVKTYSYFCFHVDSEHFEIILVFIEIHDVVEKHSSYLVQEGQKRWSSRERTDK